MATKNSIARRKYGESYDDLSPGEKATVTREYNRTGSAAPRRARAGPTVTATVGRVGQNGTQSCIMEKGRTVADLIEQARYEIDEDKESVNAKSTGNTVDLDDEVKDGEEYIITPEIKSA